MKLLHISDLHLGIKVFGHDYSMEQKHALEQILKLIDTHQPDVLLIAGDVYDSAIPTLKAISLFEEFMASLAERKIPVCIIPGNHDSAIRLTFGKDIFARSGIYLAAPFSGKPQTVDIEAGGEKLRVFMTPWFSTSRVNHALERQTKNMQEAAAAVFENPDLLEDGYNVALVHQYVAKALSDGSVHQTIGNLDPIPASLFEPFDYTALGHLHAFDTIGSDQVCYSGTQMKFSRKDLDLEKSAVLYDLESKTLERLPIEPLNDFKLIRGPFKTLMDPKFIETQNRDNFFFVELEDEDLIQNAFLQLNQVYPKIMTLSYVNRHEAELSEFDQTVTAFDPLKAADTFISERLGSAFDDEMAALLRSEWEDIDETDPADA